MKTPLQFGRFPGLLLGGLLAGITPCATAGAARLPVLKLPQAELTATDAGLGLTARNVSIPRANGGDEVLWSLQLESVRAPAATLELTSRGQQPKVETLPGGFRLIYDNLSDGKATHAIDLTLELRANEPAFVATGTLRNGTERWRVVRFTGPVIGGIEARLDRQPLLLPQGFGLKVNNAPKNLKPAAKGSSRALAWQPTKDGRAERRTSYPSGAGTMPWCAFAGADGGLYAGCHDARYGAKELVVGHDPQTGRFQVGFDHRLVCAPGQTWSLPATVFHPYQGSWQEAARYYRSWYDSVARVAPPAAWVRGASGWLLAIVKQQNQEIHWDYAALPKLCDLAEERGLDIIGLFGWAEGGHDRWYPVYTPDEKMGGAARLQASIAEAHRRHKRIIIYANGQLIDQGYEFWHPRGQAMTVRKADGTYAFQSWQKYKDTPARIHGLACLASEDWYRCMLDLALQAHRLGADGILFDQLGMTAPMTCHATGHGHAVPAVVYTADRVRLLQRIADQMRTVQPDFIVMTEGLHDSVLGSIAFFHGCVSGVFSPTPAEIAAMQNPAATSSLFPDLFRVTFPEVLTTIRNPRPMEDRLSANLACLYGFRHEIETRYAPDKAYLLEGVMPTKNTYDNIAGTRPNVDVMQATPPAEATRYLRAMIDFQRAHADLLWSGRFVGNAGFKLAGPPTLMAKGFVAGDRLGVVVWNTAKEPAAVKLTAPGYRFIESWEPEKGATRPEADLAAGGIRLLVGVRR